MHNQICNMHICQSNFAYLNRHIAYCILHIKCDLAGCNVFEIGALIVSINCLDSYFVYIHIFLFLRKRFQLHNNNKLATTNNQVLYKLGTIYNS